MNDTQTSSDGDFCPGISSVKKKRTESPEPIYVSMKSDQSMDPPLCFNDENTSSGCRYSLVHHERTESPEPSCVSMKSDQSMDLPLHFNNRNTSSGCRYSSVHQKRTESPEPSCVSMKSDQSMDPPLHFNNRNTSSGCRYGSLHHKRTESPEPIYVSMKSDQSLDPPLRFNDGNTSSGCRYSLVHHERTESPEPSCVSMKSDQSMDPPLHFNNRNTSSGCRYSLVHHERTESPEPSCVSMKSDQSMDPPLHFNNRNTSSGCRYSFHIGHPHRRKAASTVFSLSDCGLTDEGCAALASALRSNPSHLRQLDLSWNKLGSSGVTLLCAALKNPRCKLQILWLWECGVTDEGCAALASLLRSKPSHLRELVLSWNNLRDLGMKLLCTGLEEPHCKLEKLWLRDCGVTDKGCAALASALRSNPSHLRHLNLSENNLGSSEVQLLFDLKDDPHYKLQELYY